MLPGVRPDEWIVGRRSTNRIDRTGVANGNVAGHVVRAPLAHFRSSISGTSYSPRAELSACGTHRIPDPEVEHHPLILMLEVVAVDEIHASVRSTAHDDARRFPAPGDDRVHPAEITRLVRFPSDALEHLGPHAVDVDRKHHFVGLTSSQISIPDRCRRAARLRSARPA
jgi:hypothetical protein